MRYHTSFTILHEKASLTMYREIQHCDRAIVETCGCSNQTDHCRYNGHKAEQLTQEKTNT